MHGPYHAIVRVGRDLVALDADELDEGRRLVERFYEDASPALAVGATRSAVFAASLLVRDGEEAEIEIVGRVGTEPNATETVYARESVRRERDGHFVSTLGSRFAERMFVGV